MADHHETHVFHLQGQGLSLARLLKLRNRSDGRLPRFRASFGDDVRYFYDESEMKAFIKKEQSRREEELAVYEEGEEREEGENFIVIAELRESEDVEKRILAVEKTCGKDCFLKEGTRSITRFFFFSNLGRSPQWAVSKCILCPRCANSTVRS